MIRKVCVALIAVMLIAAIVPQSMAKSDGRGPSGIKPYKGLIGSDSPFYGLKLFLQDMDVSLTGNTSERLHKQLGYGRERLAEAYAMSLANNTGALNAALDEYVDEMEDINDTMDDEGIDDVTYLDAGEELNDQEDNLTDMINVSAPEAQDLLNGTLNSTQLIKNGRPFIYFNNTSYFIPPGQMKKLDWSHVPGGLAKKGYQAPAPLIDNGTVYWPWDEGYDALLANDTANGKTAVNLSDFVLPTLKNGKGGKNKANLTVNSTDVANGHGNGKGKGKK